MRYSQILLETSEGVATITLNRPERLNAWTEIMAGEVRQAVEAAPAAPSRSCSPAAPCLPRRRKLSAWSRRWWTAPPCATPRSRRRAIAANSPYASKHTKQLMWTNLDAPSLEEAIQLENHAQIVGIVSGAFAEATAAFAEKRPPVFRGR